jgi:DNA repair exonuclease SbcCD ATPase subunit
MLVPALSLGVLVVHAQQAQSQQSTGDPVADAARKAREQKKDAPKPKKVFTDDDVKPASSPETQPAANAAAPGSGEGAKSGDANGAADSGANGKNEEASWRKKFKEQRDKIAQAEKELDILQREGDKAEVQYYSDPQKAMNEQLTRKDINDHNAKIEEKQKQIAQLKQQLDDMEDALRKSGGDPGWAR